jgi:hypothetical protein
MSDKPVVNDEKIIVDPGKYDLDAAWGKQASVWIRTALKVLTCVRHQTATIAIAAIVALLWMIDARTQDTWILTVAMGLIATVAVSVELFGGRYDDYERRKGKTESPHASENEAVN